MAEGITLLEVSFEPSRGINEMIKAGYAAVLRGLGLSGARKFHAFKVGARHLPCLLFVGSGFR